MKEPSKRLLGFADLFAHASAAVIFAGIAMGSGQNADDFKTNSINQDDPISGLIEDSITFKNPLFMQFGSVAAPLVGHVDYCARLPDECSGTLTNSEDFYFDDDILGAMSDINKDVNERFFPQTDMNTYGQSEYWAYPEIYADCEDYALQKRKEFHELLGVPLSRMSIVNVMHEATGENPSGAHIVLAVRTNQGDMIFDNLTDDVKLPYQTPYQFRKGTSFHKFSEWQDVSLAEPLKIALPNGRLVTIERPDYKP